MTATSLTPGTNRVPQKQMLSLADFAKLSLLVESELGISMPESKRGMLENRLLRRIRELNLNTMSAYVAMLKTPEGQRIELPKFLDLVTTNKTSFFRELPQLDFLERKLLPRLLKEATRKRRPLRIWSAACSTGQEVWTLVMMLEQLREAVAPQSDYVVWGSDVCGEVLREAMAAKYSLNDLKEIDSRYHRFFTRSKDRQLPLVRIRPELRKRAGFFHHNLMTPDTPLPAPVDLALLRNALIYFPRARQQQIVNELAKKLTPQGHFAVGLTESLHGMSLPFRLVEQSVYQREEVR